MTIQQNTLPTSFLSTGVAGLDAILTGGLTRDRLYLIEGEPGSGKTTLGLQFLLEGARHGESVMYITLSETEVEIRAVAQAHGWNMEGIHIHEVIPDENLLNPKEQYTLFHPSEVEMGSTTQDILTAVERVKPSRMVFDSLSELQLLAGSSLRYRRQVLALKQFFATRSCTVLLLDDRTTSGGDLQVRSIAHAVISLDQVIKEYGAERRRIRIAKYRGINFRGGLHDYNIVRGGLVVYPRLVASVSRTTPAIIQLSSGLSALDALLGGGIETGTSTLIFGPPGTGKSSLAAQLVTAALARGQQAAMYLFEESSINLLNRAEGMNMPLRASLASGQLCVQQIDPAELTPGEFAEMHDGSVTANSAGSGTGSECVLVLPVVIQTALPETAPVLASLPEREQPAPDHRVVLVVDDNRDGADMLQMLLESEGFRVLTAYDGAAAVEAAQKEQPDVIVMDIGMPGMDGHEAVRRIRSQEQGHRSLIIALTGWGQASAKQQSAKAGFDHHLVKPVNFTELRHLLSR